MDQGHRKQLLEFVRRVLACELGIADEPGLPETDLLVDHSGAFVTLRNREKLRGCMGTFHAQPSVAATLQGTARSVVQDPRFVDRPVLPEELAVLTIEISVLGPRVRVHRAEQVQVGKHGILIRRGEMSGCFLPEVATERGWTAEQFLSECCRMKAKLPPDAWRDGSSEIYVFETEHFAEGE